MGNTCLKLEDLAVKNTKIIKISELRRANHITDSNIEQSHREFPSNVINFQNQSIFEIGLVDYQINSNVINQAGYVTGQLSGNKILSSDGLKSIRVDRVISIFRIESSGSGSPLFSSSSNSKHFDSINSFEFSGNKININKKSNSGKISKKNLFGNNFDDIFRKKLIKSTQLENFPNSELVHLDELMIPFPEENDLDKIQDDDYLYGCIEEIKKKIDGKLLLNKFHVDVTTKENVIEYMSLNDSEDEPFYYEENKYIGINFKDINEDYYVIYFLYAVAVKTK